MWHVASIALSIGIRNFTERIVCGVWMKFCLTNLLESNWPCISLLGNIYRHMCDRKIFLIKLCKFQQVKSYYFTYLYLVKMMENSIFYNLQWGNKKYTMGTQTISSHLSISMLELDWPLPPLLVREHSNIT